MIAKTLAVVCLVLFVAPQEPKAQALKTNKTDSLLSIIQPDAKDTANINNMILLASNLNQEGKFDDALKYAILARTNSESIHYKKGIAKSLTLSGYTYKLKGANQAAIGDLEEAEQIFKELNDLPGLGRVYSHIGSIYDNISEFQKGIVYDRLALDFYSRAHYPEGILIANNGIGMNYYWRGSYEVALEYYRKASVMADSLKLIRQQAVSFNNLGVVHERLADYPNALLYYNRCLELLQQEKLQPFVAKTLSNIGGVHVILRNYSEAKKFLDRAYTIRIQTGDKHQVYTFCNYGDLYKKLTLYDSSEWYYNQSLKIAREMNNPEEELHPLKGLGDLYLITGKLNRSRKQFETAYSIARKMNSKPWLSDIYLYKAKLDSAAGDYKSSLAWYKLYNSLYDSLYNHRKEDKITYLESIRDPAIITDGFQTGEKTDLQESKSSLLRPYWIIFVVLLFAMIFVSLVYYKNHHNMARNK